MRINTTIGFYPLSGLGDCFVLTGAVNYLSQRFDRVVFFLISPKQSRYKTVSHLFKNNPRVDVLEYNGPSEEGYIQINKFINERGILPLNRPLIYLMPGDNHYISVNGDEQNYTHLNIPFSVRYSHFKLPNCYQQAKKIYDSVVKSTEYILVASDVSYMSQPINLPKLAKNIQVININEQITDDMLLYVELIKHAKEIHCVPSSFFCFVDSITNLTRAKLFYHDIRKNTIMRVNNHWNNNRWNIVKYNEN